MLMIIQRTRTSAKLRKKFEKLFLEADKDSKDGVLTLDELKEVCELPAVRTWLGAMELEVSDCEKLFALVSKGQTTEGIGLDEFVPGLLSCKGAARQLDMKSLEVVVDMLRLDVQQELRYLKGHLDRLGSVQAVAAERMVDQELLDNAPTVRDHSEGAEPPPLV